MGTPIDDNVIEGLQHEDEEPGLVIFGRDVSKIPCFRNSFLTGIYGGVGCGIASFLATSRAAQSTHIAVVSFTVITLGFWFNCRRQWAKDYFNMKQAEDSFPEEIEAIKARKIPKEQTIQKTS